MSLDQQLPDLLSGAATGADSAPPTRAGVQTAIGRRARCRQRKRRAVEAFAATCVLAGALSGWLVLRHESQAPPVDGTELPPIIAAAGPGWELLGVEPPHRIGTPDPVIAFRRPGDHTNGPFVHVFTGSEGHVGGFSGAAVPVPGLRDSGALITAEGRTGAVSWTTQEGQITVAWHDIGRPVMTAFIRSIDPDGTNLDQIEAPPGLIRLDPAPSGPSMQSGSVARSSEATIEARVLTSRRAFENLAAEHLIGLHGDEVDTTDIRLPDGTTTRAVVISREVGRWVVLGRLSDGATLYLEVRAIDLRGVLDELEDGLLHRPPARAVERLSVPSGDYLTIGQPESSITDVEVENDRVIVTFSDAFPNAYRVTVDSQPARGRCGLRQPAFPVAGATYINILLGARDASNLTLASGPGHFQPREQPTFIGSPDGVIERAVLGCVAGPAALTIAARSPVEPSVSEGSDPTRLVIELHSN